MGGINNTKACPDSFIYDAEMHTLQQVPLTASCIFEHAAALMTDGRVLSFGGRQASRITQAVNIISFETNSVSTYLSLKNSPKARTCHTLTRLATGSFLLYGGYGGHSNYFCDLYLLHMKAEGPNWEKISKPKGELSKKRAGHSAVLLPHGPYAGKTLVFGGYNRQEYFNSIDLVSCGKKSWKWDVVEAAGTIPSPRGCHSANLTIDGNMLVWGGAGTRSVLLNDLSVLNTCTMTWSIPAMEGHVPAKRYAHCMLLTSKGLVIFGGMRQKDGVEQMRMLEFAPASLHPCAGCGQGTANAELCKLCHDRATFVEPDVSSVAESSSSAISEATISQSTNSATTNTNSSCSNTSSSSNLQQHISKKSAQPVVNGSEGEGVNQDIDDAFPEVDVFGDFLEDDDDSPATANIMTHYWESDDSNGDTGSRSGSVDGSTATAAKHIKSNKESLDSKLADVQQIEMVQKMMPVYVKAAESVGMESNPAISAQKLPEVFQARIDDDRLIRNELANLIAENVAMKESVKNAKHVLHKKQIELEQERKSSAQLRGEQLDGLSANELSGIQKTLAGAGQRLVAKQEELRVAAQRDAQIEKDMLEDRSVCCICCVEPISAVLMPCAHLCSCHGCATTLKNCPICRSVISQIIQTYMP